MNANGKNVEFHIDGCWFLVAGFWRQSPAIFETYFDVLKIWNEYKMSVSDRNEPVTSNQQPATSDKCQVTND
jgi:hypothetical protein